MITPQPRNHALVRTCALLTALMLSACGGPPPAPPGPKPEEPSKPETAEPPKPEIPTGEQGPVRLANGITAHFRVSPRGSDTLIQLGIFGGSATGAPGLAELTAHVVVESSDPTTGRASLRRQVEKAGGNVDVQVGLLTTWLDIRVPGRSAEMTLQLVRSALETVTQSRSQIERMRNDLVARTGRELARNPLRVITRVMLQGERSSADYLNALLDLDPSEVSLFHTRFYRPETSMLAIAMPRHVDEILPLLQQPKETALAGWRPQPPIPGKPRFLDRTYGNGLYWAETANPRGNLQAAIVMQLPDATVPGAAEWLMMHSCLTLDGTGGRLERMLDEAGLPPIDWRSRIEQTPDRQALVLTAAIPAPVAAEVWRVFVRARQSLTQFPPTTSELELALRRSQLNATLTTISDAARLRLAANLATRKLAPDALANRLRELADPSAWDANQAAVAFQKTPAWMVVTGPAPAPEVAGVVPFKIFPEGFAPNRSAAATPQVIAATGPWLRKARAAMGGDGAFDKVIGFEATSTLAADQAPPTKDTLTWQMTGKLTRQREVMGQTITTQIDKKSGSETLEKGKQHLSETEVGLLRHEMMRHPLMLLAANHQGKLKFRPVAQRTSGDRELMVLEALGKEFDRLRIHIDTQSYLIRKVESWERLPDDTLVHVQEVWSDYRAAGALRAPHRLRTEWNDGEHQTETEFSEWRPILRR